MQLVDLRLAARPRLRGASKGRGHPVDRLPLLRRDHRMMNALPGAQLRQRQLPPDRPQPWP